MTVPGTTTLLHILHLLTLLFFLSVLLKNEQIQSLLRRINLSFTFVLFYSSGMNLVHVEGVGSKTKPQCECASGAQHK